MLMLIKLLAPLLRLTGNSLQVIEMGVAGQSKETVMFIIQVSCGARMQRSISDASDSGHYTDNGHYTCLICCGYHEVCFVCRSVLLSITSVLLSITYASP